MSKPVTPLDVRKKNSQTENSSSIPSSLEQNSQLIETPLQQSASSNIHKGEGPNYVGSSRQDPEWKAKGLDGIRQPGAFADSASLPQPQMHSVETSESPRVIIMGNKYNQQLQEAQEIARRSKRSHEEQMLRLHAILLQILMGDITGAIRSYGVLMNKDMREFGRAVLTKLGEIKQARSRVITRFAFNKPPQAYSGDDPGRLARFNRDSSNYNLYVQTTTQLMGDFQNTERELVDFLHSMQRDINAFWQAYDSMRTQDARTSERLMTIR